MVQRSAAIPDLVGQFIDQGRLKLVDTLGSGSNGVVFLAIDTTSSPQYPTYYAVKCLIKADKGSHLHDVQQQEIAHHMRCSAHSNVITLHRVVEEHFYLFLVLDYCSGGDFFQFLFEGGIPRDDDALVKKLFLQIIDGVEACHQMGIYHRDIKPENILVNESGTRVFLSDFGLSTGRAFSRTYGAGSSYYMSPECIGIHGPITPYSTRANDVWALGVILTAMISGHNPWRRATYIDECYRAYLQDQDFLYRTLPISSSANDILQRIFTSDPSRRITIPFLRLKIMQVDTFFLTDQDVKSKNKGRRKRSVKSTFRVWELPAVQEGRHDPAWREPNTDWREPCDGKFDDDSASLRSADICTVPRSSPTDASMAATGSESDITEPRTPELVAAHIQPAIPAYHPPDVKQHVAVAPKSLWGSGGGSSSTGFLRRMAERLYLCS